jgi:hypothetical protein
MSQAAPDSIITGKNPIDTDSDSKSETTTLSSSSPVNSFSRTDRHYKSEADFVSVAEDVAVTLIEIGQVYVELMWTTFQAFLAVLTLGSLSWVIVKYKIWVICSLTLTWCLLLRQSIRISLIILRLITTYAQWLCCVLVGQLGRGWKRQSKSQSATSRDQISTPDGNSYQRARASSMRGTR